MVSDATQLIACAQCDALQRIWPRDAQYKALCVRCGSRLGPSRPVPAALLAGLAITGLVLWIICNCSPLLLFTTQGTTRASSFISSVVALWQADYRAIALVVLLTVVIMPALILLSTLYLTACISLRQRGLLGQLPSAFRPVVLLAQGVRAWSMIEVFMAGTLVSFVRLAAETQARVYPGAALLACALLVAVLLILAAQFHPRDLWDHLPVRESLTHDA
jgi:paraquat-inducible protein A